MIYQSSRDEKGTQSKELNFCFLSPATKQLLCRAKEERQPRTDETNPQKILRHDTGNKAPHLTELHFLKRDLKKYKGILKEDIPNRFHGQQHKQAA